MAQTGNTGTLANAGGWVGAFIRIGELTDSMPALDDSDLSNTAVNTKTRGDLIELEPITCEVFYDPEDPPPLIISEQWIVTFPFPTGATIVGSGFLTETTTPELVNNQLMIANLALQFDGITGPIFITPTDTFASEFSTEFA